MVIQEEDNHYLTKLKGSSYRYDNHFILVSGSNEYHKCRDVILAQMSRLPENERQYLAFNTKNADNVINVLKAAETFFQIPYSDTEKALNGLDSYTTRVIIKLSPEWLISGLRLSLALLLIRQGNDYPYDLQTTFESWFRQFKTYGNFGYSRHEIEKHVDSVLKNGLKVLDLYEWNLFHHAGHLGFCTAKLDSNGVFHHEGFDYKKSLVVSQTLTRPTITISNITHQIVGNINNYNDFTH